MQLQREISNYVSRQLIPPYVTTCCQSSRNSCAIREVVSTNFNDFPASYRNRNRNFFIRPCPEFPCC